ncbi:MAG: DNA photolyase [Verrucomicrobia bacterium]|nr:DNA photolyase [Verrucomicrobiota bacterium]
MRTYPTTLTTGIQASPEFAKKGLAQFAVNIGTKCGHDCLYCSTGSLLRMHPSFKDAGQSPFEFGYAIVDPDIPGRVARDAARMRNRGLIQLCTTVDAWAPEAQECNLGRRCLEAILAESDWTVRVLTKNAAVRQDYDVIMRHRDRVLVGLSLTTMPKREAQMSVVEQNASRITERLAALQETHQFGLRTYGMLCPLLPGIADDYEALSELVVSCLGFGAEEIFVEPVNPRGPGLRLTQEALLAAGFEEETAAVGRIRSWDNWSQYCTGLIATVQQVMGEQGALEKLRFLLYPNHLTDGDRRRIRGNDAGVKWLGN